MPSKIKSRRYYSHKDVTRMLGNPARNSAPFGYLHPQISPSGNKWHEDGDAHGIVTDAQQRYIDNGWMPNRKLSESAATKRDTTALMSMEGALTAAVHNAIQGYDMFDKGKDLRGLRGPPGQQGIQGIQGPAHPPLPHLSEFQQQRYNENVREGHAFRREYRMGDVELSSTPSVSLSPRSRRHDMNIIELGSYEDRATYEEQHHRLVDSYQDQEQPNREEFARVIQATHKRLNIKSGRIWNKDKQWKLPKGFKGAQWPPPAGNFATSKQETAEAAQEDVSVLEKKDERPQGIPVEQANPPPELAPPDILTLMGHGGAMSGAPPVAKKTRLTKKKRLQQELETVGVKWRKSWNAKKLQEKLTAYNINKDD